VLAILVARPISVDPSSSSTGWDSVGDAVSESWSRLATTAATDDGGTDVGKTSFGSTNSGLGPANDDWTVACGREDGEVSFSGRSTIYFCVSQRNHALMRQILFYAASLEALLLTWGEECGVGVDERSGEWSTSMGSPPADCSAADCSTGLGFQVAP
jgi:hypothetical protein